MFWKIIKIGDDPVIDFAAAELKKYMSHMDDSLEYVIMSFEGYRSSVESAVWLGLDKAFPVPEVADRKLDDGISICVHGQTGYISGTNSRSVLMGVYRFLKELGCAFVRPGTDGEVIPKRILADVNVEVLEAPSYRHRGVCIEGAVSAEHVLRNIDWLPKVGMNSFFNQFQIPFTFYDRWYTHLHNPEYEPENFNLEDAEGIMNASVSELKRRGLLYHAAGHGWTCEPFGIEGSGWDVKDYEVPEETKPYLALVNGKRELWGGVPLNTNLCYSSEYVKDTMAHAVAEYCLKYPTVDVVHIWLADASNNHCECEQCKDHRPADLYVELLNRIDEVLTEKFIETKVVFLIYVDLLWEPLKARLENPDRFILMFAPITRTYTQSLADAEVFDIETLLPYEKNKAIFPKSVSENLARLFKWQEHFEGDSFVYDYHYMWDHFLDPGYFEMARILYRDMKHLDKYHLGGMISCQNQRVFFPTGLGMTAMAEVLWDKTIAFEDIAERYFYNAFGAEGKAVIGYLEKLSELFQPPYLRGECSVVDAAIAEKYAQIPGVVDQFAQKIRDVLADTSLNLESAQRKSWEYLVPHGELCKLMAHIFECTAKGLWDEAKESFDKTLQYACCREKELHNVFDVCLFTETIERTMKGLCGGE